MKSEFLEKEKHNYSYLTVLSYCTLFHLRPAGGLGISESLKT